MRNKKPSWSDNRYTPPKKRLKRKRIKRLLNKESAVEALKPIKITTIYPN